MGANRRLHLPLLDQKAINQKTCIFRQLSINPSWQAFCLVGKYPSKLMGFIGKFSG
jgi:hypothetical protein